MMIPDFYRPSPKYPTYPPYHTGLYLEDYFYEWSKTKQFKRQYIPIFWTTIYCDNLPINIQGILDRLPRDGKYFTVCQHDDAPKERLPSDTMIFSSASRIEDPRIVPIPSICSRIPNPKYESNPENKDFFCSFVGANTHPIRDRIIQKWMNHPDYVIMSSSWTPSVSNNSFELFKSITRRSVFALCPRGYGKTSFRLYESMQLGAIPVFVSDVPHWIPWRDKVDWNNVAVLVNEDQIGDLDSILRGISIEKRSEMLSYTASIYDKYFSLNGMSENIMERVNR